ncbi:5'-nucleotidase [Actinomyces ruminicola]|uniref:5'-nucleotidase n=1 Tax=Actinomyces ruminicola TaxID=332524 RepID=A0A1H0B0H3_9ACTO|nr:bifunctional UDP-sugar hydrolase/5'-nucleotidase [Actinomyces ruminicola]SDN39119.1 5'-nucleotidase [Actinomyces ruminicola]
MRPQHLVRASVSVTALALAVFAPAAVAPPAGALTSAQVGGPVVVAAPTAGLLADAVPADEGGAATVNLLGITDFGGHLERVSTQSEGVQVVAEPGAVTLACEVAAARASQPNTLLVSTGDNVGGSAYISSVLDDQPTIDILGAIGLDVTAAGNHEFDGGARDLSSRLLGAIDAPVLAANVIGNDALSAEGDGDGVWTTEVDGVTVGFVGVVTDSLPTLVAETALAGMEVTDLVETANARAAALKDGDESNGEADVVVVLAHEDADVYSNQFNGSVDAVFGGHTHHPHASAVTGRDGNRIAVVQSGQYGELLGNITLSVDRDSGAVSVLAVKNIDLTASTCTADAYGVQAIVDQAARDSRVAGSRVLTALDRSFYRGTNDGSDPGANRSTESTAANVIADSYRAWLTTEVEPDGDHYIGLMNPGGVRADYLLGDLTEGEAYTVQPFGNEMGYATYSGAQLKAVLAQQWQPDTSRPLLMLGVSGNVRVYIDQDAADELEEYWSRISAGEQAAADLEEAVDAARARVIRSVYVDDVELADDASVVVASNSFMLSGGDGFTGLREATVSGTGVLDRTVTAEYLQAGGAVSADLAKRQIGVDLDAAVGGTATVRFTGLSFTAASEQTAPGAAQEVTATVALADGGTQQLTSAAIDTTVTPELPETGTTTLSIALPADVATTACPAGGRQGEGVSAAGACAVVSFTLVARDGSTRSVDFQALVPVAAAAAQAEARVPAVSNQVVVAPEDEPTVAGTGIPDSLGSAGATALALLAAAGVACYRVVRRGLLGRLGAVPSDA